MTAMDKKLSAQHEKFARQFAEHGNAGQAYREAYGEHTKNFSYQNGYTLRHRPEIAARIRELHAMAVGDTIIGVRARMARLQDLVEANPGELVKVITEACRYCHGYGHAYQWVDDNEYVNACIRAMDAEETAPLNDGGYGYDPRRGPADDCPKCFGEGHIRVRVTPTDQLSVGAQRLLKSVKQKATGEIEVQLYDQNEASDQLNKMQNVYVERNLTVTVDAKPLPENATEQEAARYYLSLMGS